MVVMVVMMMIMAVPSASAAGHAKNVPSCQIPFFFVYNCPVRFEILALFPFQSCIIFFLCITCIFLFTVRNENDTAFRRDRNVYTLGDAG